MEKEPKRRIALLANRDLWHHVLLAIILLGGYMVFRSVSYSRMLQFAVGCGTAILYVIWGIIHHYLDGDLYFKNMVEYIFIALLSVVILAGILL